jgi:zinc protease
MRSRLLFLLTLLAALPALATPPKIDQKTLPDGLTVLVVENHALPLVTVEIAARNGSMTEPPDYNGLSHLYEHMFFKANQVVRSQEAWIERAHALGLAWNGTTNTERVNYFFTTTSDHFKDTMSFMHDAIVTPLFDPKELDRERVVVTGEIDRNEGNPFYYLNHSVNQRVFWKFPSRKDPLGNRATVLKTTVAQLQTIQDRYYVPNNSVLVVTGDVKADDVFAMAEQLYKDWPRGADPFVKYPLVQHPAIPFTSVVLVQQPVRAVAGQLVWQGPSTVGKDVELTYASDLLSSAIGEPSSKFQRDLVDSGACLSVNVSWFTQMNVGPITASFQAPAEKVDGCIQAILLELPKLKDAAVVTDEDLKNALFDAQVGEMTEREKPSALANSLTFWWTSAGLDYYLTYTEKMKAATREQIARYLDTYVLGKPFVLGVLLSPEMVKEQHLDEAHFDALVSGKPWVEPGAKSSKATNKKTSNKEVSR